MYAGHALGQAIVQHDVHLQVLAKRHLVRHADAQEHVLEHLLVRAVSSTVRQFNTVCKYMCGMRNMYQMCTCIHLMTMVSDFSTFLRCQMFAAHAIRTYLDALR